MAQHILFIFAKWPEPGKVKTRMAASIGANAAAARYREMVEQVVDQTTPNGQYDRVLYFDPPEAAAKFQEWLPAISAQHPQCAGDLGARMSGAFEECFARGAKKVCIIGSDCLDVDTTLIQEAFAKLDNHDLVIGPAEDGGYYLLGMNQLAPTLFTEIAWSTATVCQTTIARAEQGGLTVTTLPTLADLDY